MPESVLVFFIRAFVLLSTFVLRASSCYADHRVSQQWQRNPTSVLVQGTGRAARSRRASPRSRGTTSPRPQFGQRAFSCSNRARLSRSSPGWGSARLRGLKERMTGSSLPVKMRWTKSVSRGRKTLSRLIREPFQKRWPQTRTADEIHSKGEVPRGICNSPRGDWQEMSRGSPRNAACGLASSLIHNPPSTQPRAGP